MTTAWVGSLSGSDRAADLRGGGWRWRWRWRWKVVKGGGGGSTEKLNGRARGGGREKVEEARWSGFVDGRFETSILLKI